MEKAQEKKEKRPVVIGVGGCVKIFFCLIAPVELVFTLIEFGYAIYLGVDGAESAEVLKHVGFGGLGLMCLTIIVFAICCGNPALWCLLLLVYGLETLLYGIVLILLNWNTSKVFEIIYIVLKFLSNFMVSMVAFYLLCCNCKITGAIYSREAKSSVYYPSRDEGGNHRPSSTVKTSQSLPIRKI